MCPIEIKPIEVCISHRYISHRLRCRGSIRLSSPKVTRGPRNCIMLSPTSVTRIADPFHFMLDIQLVTQMGWKGEHIYRGPILGSPIVLLKVTGGHVTVVSWAPQQFAGIYDFRVCLWLNQGPIRAPLIPPARQGHPGSGFVALNCLQKLKIRIPGPH